MHASHFDSKNDENGRDDGYSDELTIWCDGGSLEDGFLDVDDGELDVGKRERGGVGRCRMWLRILYSTKP